jgi:hypothetical protein
MQRPFFNYRAAELAPAAGLRVDPARCRSAGCRRLERAVAAIDQGAGHHIFFPYRRPHAVAVLPTNHGQPSLSWGRAGGDDLRRIEAKAGGV